MDKFYNDTSKFYLKQGIPLPYDRAYELGVRAVRSSREELSAADAIASIALLVGFHTRGIYSFNRKTAGILPNTGHEIPEDAAEQIAGICAAVFDEDIKKSSNGFLNPGLEAPVIDNCGMGGDLLRTANVSTIAALIAARSQEVFMCKHGSPGNADAGRQGSSDFLKDLGLSLHASPDTVARSLREHCFGYTDALNTGFKTIHRQTHGIVPLSHMNDLIGPITNPLSASVHRKKIIGLNDLLDPGLVARSYVIMNENGVTNLERGLFVRGFGDNERDGMDEVSICMGGTRVAELRDGEIHEYTLTAENFGLEPVGSMQIVVPEGMSKGDFSMSILGKTVDNRAPVNMVLANAALLFHLNGEDDLRQCFEQARQTYYDHDLLAFAEQIASTHQ